MHPDRALQVRVFGASLPLLCRSLCWGVFVEAEAGVGTRG